MEPPLEPPLAPPLEPPLDPLLELPPLPSELDPSAGATQAIVAGIVTQTARVNDKVSYYRMLVETSSCGAFT